MYTDITPTFCEVDRVFPIDPQLETCVSLFLDILQFNIKDLFLFLVLECAQNGKRISLDGHNLEPQE